MRSGTNDNIERAAQIIAEADALLIAAGAGMGVDSGLPDFRGTEGFWRSYPPYQRLGYDFTDVANPEWFRTDPALAWGFYGHRLHLYQKTRPHEGFSLLLALADKLPSGAFVFTSNVDGQFQRAGFNRENILECHGSLHHLQCIEQGCDDIWPVADAHIEVNEETMRAVEPFPLCPNCGAVARPNVVMFYDSTWIAARTDRQARRFSKWMDKALKTKLVIVECGAGTGISTVREQSEHHAQEGVPLIRINPRDADVPEGAVGIELGALKALTAINSLLP